MAPVAIALLASACWRDGPGPAPPPLRPEPVAAEEPKPKTRWKPSPPREQPVEAATVREPADIARDLQASLRKNAASDLPSYVSGPVVVLDLDAGSLGAACDAAALTGAQTWGQMLVDPARANPSCRPSTGNMFTCSQFAQGSILIMQLADPDQWRIVSVIVGNYRNGRTTLHANMSQMQSLIATATCP